ncbi:ferredoxin [Phytohabitans sp. ZYX-F-186]|uniref:Ferredoxin n=1 Tax=Phytohabitans maris TaxID=3071409 RepID=A0ABU0ZSZ8_9ACTN|nr:ferredoxin [Phytohabitans sp. ZYX-F-186]MDQ7909350.1 ferredoxin [Phytohabitans sp. ZYX-F-186]
MKVTVDPELCEGNAVCEALAPEVFAVGNDWQAKVLAPEVPDADRELVRRAAESCPRLAIMLTG